MLWALRNWYYNNRVYTPKASTIDLSGVIKSDHPAVDNGWIKGWLVDNGKKDTVIVCRHSNPSVSTPNNTVFAKSGDGWKHYRKIVEVQKIDLKNYDLDIAVCRLESPFPADIVAYKFAERLKEGQKTLTLDQYGKISEANLSLNSKKCTVSGGKRKHMLISGDSGLPWFVWEKDEWRVATHTHRGLWGIGPWYSHKELYSPLKKYCNDL